MEDTAFVMPHIDTIPLGDAVLCCNCEVISRGKRDKNCVACGSGSTLPLASVIGAIARATSEYIEETEQV